MTTIIVKKRKKLSLPDRAVDKTSSKTLTLKPKNKEKELTGEEKTRINNERQTQERLERIEKAKQWLITNWPRLFDQENIRPLGLTVGNSLKEAYAQEREKGLGFRWNHISVVLSRWVRQKKYTKALKNETHRYNLDGSQAEEIQDAERKPRPWERSKKNQNK